MAERGCQDVTRLLVDWSAGDQEALDALLPLVYAELHRQARGFLRHERADHTLQPTALVHEAYLRLIDQKRVRWRNRGHFFAIAARMMRRILINHARARAALRRGGGVPQVRLDEAIDLRDERADDLLALDDALEALARLDPRQARVVELRFFGGLTHDETAAALAISRATVKREWSLARAWLEHELSVGRERAG